MINTINNKTFIIFKIDIFYEKLIFFTILLILLIIAPTKAGNLSSEP